MPAPIILVVEDDPALLELVTDRFTDRGHETCGARLLFEAQRLAAERRFDLIIIDLNLPDGTGIEFITWLRSLRPAQGRDTPCVAITGHQHLGLTAAAAGFRATVRKPIDIGALVRLAEDLL